LLAKRPSNGRNLLPKISVNIKGLCAKLPAPRDRGSPGANPTVWFQAGFCKGFCAKLPAPPDRGSPSANRRFGLKPVFVTTWKEAVEKRKPP